MIAYLDAEFNCDNDNKAKRTDYSVIEVALVIEDTANRKKVFTYRTYVKPMLNDGKIYPRITDMTGIKQEDLDNAPSFVEVFARLIELAREYNLEQIYTWGGYDAMAFRWNAKLYDPVQGKNRFLKLFMDVSPLVKQELKQKEEISLTNAAYIYECPKGNEHNALDDAQLLRKVIHKVKDNAVSKERLQKFNAYHKQKRAYSKLKNVFNEIRQSGADVNEMIELALNGKDFPGLE